MSPNFPVKSVINNVSPTSIKFIIDYCFNYYYIAFSCVKIFEKLPQCIKQSKLKQFKSNLIEYLNERCFYNLNGFLNYP